MKKPKFSICFNVYDTKMSKEEFIYYLMEVFQIGQQRLKEDDIKEFSWDLASYG